MSAGEHDVPSPVAAAVAVGRDRRQGRTGIDERVYRLYGLTKDEIKIVERAM